MRKYPYLLATSILGLLLVPPFLLKTLSASLEPYPAIILPAGPHQVELTGDRVNFTRLSLWGKKPATGSWTRIDSKKFLAPIPHEYLENIIDNSFGLEVAEKKYNNIFQQNLFAILHAKISANDRKDTKKWLRYRLSKQNLDNKKLRISQEEGVFDINTGQIVSLKTKNERVFELD